MEREEYMMKSCFFIGHRNAPESVLGYLTQAIEMLILEENVRCFYVGAYGSFDRLAALAVRRLKRVYPQIILMLVIPYHPSERPVVLCDGFDGSYYPEGLESTPRRYAIVRANKAMVDIADWLIAYACHPASNARNVLEYAQRREKKGLIQTVNLAEIL